jgi:hypothetical protein
MKSKYPYTLLILILLLTTISCTGDRKSLVRQDLEDTSFVNKNFKGNLVDFDEKMSACDQITTNEISSLYGFSAVDVVIQDASKLNLKNNSKPSCMFYIKSGASDFEWLRGSISVEREIAKDEYMGDIAEAVGSGENWKEAWSLKKSMYKSSEWVPGLGLAAIWNKNKTTLEIKFDGYTLVVNPIKNVLNKEEVAHNRDYKKMALGLARAGGYIN